MRVSGRNSILVLQKQAADDRDTSGGEKMYENIAGTY